jgi:inhibitor of cysteine peptidase
MKTMLFVGLLIGMASVLSAAEPSTPALEKILRDADNGAVIVLTSKSRLMIRLHTQSGTGYTWTPKSTSTLLRLAKSYVESPAHPMPGGTETQVFLFTPIAKGTDEIELEYRRPWEHGGPPAKKFRFTANVQ